MATRQFLNQKFQQTRQGMCRHDIKQFLDHEVSSDRGNAYSTMHANREAKAKTLMHANYQRVQNHPTSLTRKLRGSCPPCRMPAY